MHPLHESDINAADRIFRLAFGTFLGLPDPSAFGGDADYVRTRSRTDPSAAFGTYADGEHRDGQLNALAVCHCGANTEAGTGTCYVKFGAARPGRTAADDFDALLTACEEFAAEEGASRLSAGVNTARHGAYVRLMQRGFRTDMHGVAMQRPNEDGYSRTDVYLLDDWR